MGQRLLRGLLAVAVLVAPLAAAQPIELQGARFAPSHEVAERELRLVGAGVVTYRLFFDVYAAGLYLPGGATRSQALAAQTPRRLEIEYFYDIAAEDLAKAARKILERQHSETTLAAVRPRIEAFHALYRDVKEGDRYAMTYRPGEGTTLTLNGQDLGTVPGDEFARLYFGIWLGEDPLSNDLRTALLSRL